MSAACVSAAVVAVGALSASPLPAFGATDIGNLEYAGERAGGSRLKFPAGDSVVAQVDVGSGNLSVSVRGLALRGVKTQIQTGAFYNSVAVASIGASTRLGRGWGLDYTPSVSLTTNTDSSVTYTGPGGLTGLFTLRSGSTSSYDAPSGFTVDLTKTSSGWTMKDHQSQSQQKFNTSGDLVSRQDRDANLTRVNDVGAGALFKNLEVVAPAGPTASRTLTVRTDAAATTTQAQNVGSETRQVSYTRSNGTMTAFTDALGRQTAFGYDSAGRMTSIAAPGSVGTTFAYDSTGRVTSITQAESATGGPGNAVTRLAYVSPTETDVADPTTDQAQAATVVPHATYTLNTKKRVEKVKDAENRPQTKTYNPISQATATAGVGLTGTSSESTLSNTFGANGGESLTKSVSNGGLEMTMDYANTSGPAQYQPSGGSSSGVSRTYTYSGTGNALSSTGQGGTETASLDYNSDGTVSAAASPKSSTNKTGYTYNGDHQLTRIDPKSGSSLGAQDLTYDAYGRTRTATDGRGITATYAYDKLDRPTTTTFTGGMSVSYGYDAAGRNSSRTDPTGTTSYGYDQLGRMVSRGSTFGAGETFRYGYNKAGWLTSSTSATGGTISYAYDNAGKASSVSYPQNGGTRQMIFYTDSHGRRTEAFLGSNPEKTQWVAHYKYTYDKNDKVIRVLGEQGSGTTSNTDVVDLTYCYRTDVAPGNSCTADGPSWDRLKWTKDNLSGKVTRYNYKTNGKINQVINVNADGTDGSIVYDYAYDGNGNRFEGDHNGQGVIDLAFNPENQITTTGYGYDGAGNLTVKPGLSGITYTGADQLASVTKSGTTYTYQHAGTTNDELLQQTTPQGTYTYAYGRPAQTGVPTVETVTHDGETANVITDPTTGQPLMLRSSSGMQSMYIYDGTPGSPIALITSAAYEAFAYEYDPYGLPTLTADSGGNGVSQNPFLFAGGIQDRTTGWVHYGNRYYDPPTGTWTQRDTLDDPLSPSDANRYAYAGGDPLNNIDPTGNKHCVAGFVATATYTIGVGAIIGATVAAAPFTAGTSAAIGVGLGAAAFTSEYFIDFDKACG